MRDGNLAKVTGFKKTEKAKRLQKIVRNRCKKGKKLNSRAHTHTHTPNLPNGVITSLQNDFFFFILILKNDLKFHFMKAMLLINFNIFFLVSN